MNATHFHNLKFFLFGRDLRVQCFLLEKMKKKKKRVIFLVYLFIYFLLTEVNFHLTAIIKFQKNELGHEPSLGEPTLKSNIPTRTKWDPCSLLISYKRTSSLILSTNSYKKNRSCDQHTLRALCYTSVRNI